MTRPDGERERPQDDDHQECLDSLAFTVVGATTLSSRRFAENELRAALDRRGLYGCITRFVIVRRSQSEGGVVVRLRISGDLHLTTSSDPLDGDPPGGPKTPA